MEHLGEFLNVYPLNGDSGDTREPRRPLTEYPSSYFPSSTESSSNQFTELTELTELNQEPPRTHLRLADLSSLIPGSPEYLQLSDAALKTWYDMPYPSGKMTTRAKSNQIINQNNQSTNQSTNPTVNAPASQSANQSTDIMVNRLAIQSANQSIGSTVNRSVSQSANQSKGGMNESRPQNYLGGTKVSVLKSAVPAMPVLVDVRDEDFGVGGGSGMESKGRNSVSSFFSVEEKTKKRGLKKQPSPGPLSSHAVYARMNRERKKKYLMELELYKEVMTRKGKEGKEELAEMTKETECLTQEIAVLRSQLVGNETLMSLLAMRRPQQ